MKNKYIFLAMSMVAIFAFANCSKKAKYESLVKEGLESGVRHDTLFLGLWLGMSSEDFYKKCWELNKEGVIRQGDGNTSVLYELEENVKAVVDLNFYPEFFSGKIYQMPVTFRYKAWAPWNQTYSGDTLHLELLRLFEGWYGKGFMEVENEMKGKAFVKVDGNRRISLYKGINADGIVWALYTDMSVDKEAREEKFKSIK